MIRFPMPILLAGSICLLTSSSAAQTQQEWRAAGESPQEFTIEQSYHGTRPGQGNRLPRVEELRSKPGGWVTWPGFLMREDGGSRLFLQTTRPLQYKRAAGKQRFTLHFEDAKVHLSNNKNPLVTAFFNTPVKRAWLKRRGKNVDLVVELKVAALEAVTQYSDNDGYHYLLIDFPPGDYPSGAGFAPRPAAASSGAWTSFGAWGSSGSAGQYTPISGVRQDSEPAPAAEPEGTDTTGGFYFSYGFGDPSDPEPPPSDDE